ncbi:cache domain-containing sensor histidine kinase [Paenibacillus mucilaginosus]|uniref:histidine kinase n=2 Tax=Paenibacillus mucilaginosus TaxID=61624 RepID=H6NL13_9BACL|nr:sensor histidine kinase [Paenibacillus mucilaginosus]AEI40709.1 integral membrane sensor signal transduction histidine kinase [Paenibacillus mucilaginosus KNP414]AFC29319.1 integral membrane sensor signal transduction histidine kinase [Paenibacillus mucilaginosus 3016]MCG7211808.1 sensor histidine kinase [Paenibacillus mucilaginosus]WDM29842.1 sensor histidine kinase [Paenibacillus mucilaginosus]WFA18037.1 sensor histidine kinase [Paenibacillus mucilaginosus]
MFYSLKNGLIAFFVLLLVLSFGTVSYLLFHESRSIIRSYIESSALEKMDEYGSFISMATTHMYDLSSLVFNSDITRSWDNALSDPALPQGEKMLANIAFSQFLTRTTNSYSGISSVSVYRGDGTRIGAGNQVASDLSFLREAWYDDFVRRGNHWVPAHTDPVEAGLSRPYPVVSLLLPIGAFEPTASRPLMKINVSADFLLEPLNRIHLGESGTIFLLDQEGRPMLPQQQDVDLSEAMAKAEEIRAGAQPQGVVYTKNGEGTTDILVYKKLKPNNWLLVGVVSEGDLYAKLMELRDSILLITSLLLLCAILAASWLSYGITKPLSRLASAMRLVQKGDFELAESRIPPERYVRNEVGYVTSSFRAMVTQLRQHIRTEFEQKLLRQQAEYKALLLQINPHFLFNTLELLSSLTMQGRQRDAVRVIESLGKMLRFSLKISDDVIPLEEELRVLRHYLSILQIRFGERLHLTLEEEGETAGRLPIVKFLLQPLVENAVAYAFSVRPEAKVTVRIRCADGRLQLTVADNGPGMPPELVQRLHAETAAAQLQTILSSTGPGQIGLRNVLSRCRLYYGPLFTFAIDTREDEGTSIELHLPAGGNPHDV